MFLLSALSLLFVFCVNMIFCLFLPFDCPESHDPVLKSHDPVIPACLPWHCCLHDCLTSASWLCHVSHVLPVSCVPPAFQQLPACPCHVTSQCYPRMPFPPISIPSLLCHVPALPLPLCVFTSKRQHTKARHTGQMTNDGKITNQAQYTTIFKVSTH